MGGEERKEDSYSEFCIRTHEVTEEGLRWRIRSQDFLVGQSKFRRQEGAQRKGCENWLQIKKNQGSAKSKEGTPGQPVFTIRKPRSYISEKERAGSE